jgi:hypothetical protein
VKESKILSEILSELKISSELENASRIPLRVQSGKTISKTSGIPTLSNLLRHARSIAEKGLGNPWEGVQGQGGCGKVYVTATKDGRGLIGLRERGARGSALFTVERMQRWKPTTYYHPSGRVAQLGYYY